MINKAGKQGKVENKLKSLKVAKLLRMKVKWWRLNDEWLTDRQKNGHLWLWSCFATEKIEPSEYEILLLSTLHCHTPKVASWHVDCRYERNFYSNLRKVLSKSRKKANRHDSCNIVNFYKFFIQYSKTV